VDYAMGSLVHFNDVLFVHVQAQKTRAPGARQAEPHEWLTRRR